MTKVVINKLPTGIVGLDDVLGGGLPEFSFNVIAGGPGSGKTTLAHQIMFATATPAQPALYITVVGETPLKMLRYQQQYAFFDERKLSGAIRFLHLGDELLEHGLETVLAEIIKEVEATQPKLVFVDSFRAVVRKSLEPEQLDLQSFVQRLAIHLTSWQATTFLIGEYEEMETHCNPLFTVADGILWLSQVVQRNSIVRKVQIVKMRGQGSIPGLHTMRITDAGVRVYPRLPNPEQRRPVLHESRRKTGVAALDVMLGGGIPAGYSVMIVGPSGSGKTMLSTQFIREGIEQGEHGLIALFEKRPDEYLLTAPGAAELQVLVDAGKLSLLYLRPLDLSVDETMQEIADTVKANHTKRIVIDSLMGFELALAPSFREDFRESLYRMVGGLVSLGVTVMMTAELVDGYAELRLSPHGISFLTDGIILQRYVELNGSLRKVITVAKMRGFEHSKELRLYEIDAKGLLIGEPLANYGGVLVGNPQRTT